MKDIFNENKWHFLELNSVVVAPVQPKGRMITTTRPPPLYQIALKTDGHSSIIYKGKPLEFTAGSILYIPMEKKQPTARYDKYIVEEGSSIVFFFSSEEDLPDEAFVYELDNSNILFDYFRQLYNTWIGKSPTYYCDCMSLVYKIISQLQRRNLSGHDSEYYRNRLIRSVAYIHTHFRDQKIDQHRLAEISDMNYDYFRHIFKQAYGVSPVQYINRLKIDHSKELLASGLYSIQEISEITGFASQYYFSRYFKNLNGISPSQYRDSLNTI